MSKKLLGNGLFESSRMMLPEHKEAFILHQQNLLKKSRPQIDEQEMEQFSRIIAESIQYKEEITLILFAEFKDVELRGIVKKVDHQQKKIKLAQDDNFIWINITDIIDVIL